MFTKQHAAPIWLFICLAQAFGVPSHLAADQPSWTVAHADPKSQLVSAEPFPRTLRHSQGHRFRVAPWRDSWSHLAARTGHLALIAEHAPVVRVKVSRPGPQLMVRVVLPRTADEAGNPLTIVLEGDVCERPDEWTDLQISDLTQKLDGQIRILRSRGGNGPGAGSVDAREAYIDLISVRVFGHRDGIPTDVWLCDFQPPVPATNRLASWATPNRAHGRSPSRLTQHGRVLKLNEQIFVPRIVVENGESWEFLKSLGCNTIALGAAPTLPQSEAARRLGLWLIAPPPDTVDGAGLFGRVIAWDLGCHPGIRLNERALEGAFERLSLEKDGWSALSICPANAAGSLVQKADIVLHRQHAIGTQTDLVAHANSTEEHGVTHPEGFWYAVQTELPSEVRAQADAFGAAGDQMVPQPPQIELVTAIGAAHGANGFWFDSQQRLDLATPQARLRAAAIKLANARLLTIEPWIAAGDHGQGAECLEADCFARLLRLPRASLLMVNHLPPSGQRALACGQRSMEVTVSGISAENDAWLLSHDSPTQLPVRRLAGGISVPIDKADHANCILITSDETVLHRLTHQPSACTALARAATTEIRALRRYWAATDEQLATIHRQSPLHSWPACAHVSGLASRNELPLPGSVAAAVNLLPSGNFEQSSDLGWEFGRRDGSHSTAVLCSEAAYSGLNGLKLFCAETNAQGKPSVWAASPPVALSSGQLIQVKGRIKVRTEAQSGRVVISDTLGRGPLAINVSATDGWQEFNLLRAATESEAVQISFVMIGTGSACIDNVTITPTNR